MQRLLDDSPGPGQAQAIKGIEMSYAVREKGSPIEIRWIPCHAGVEGNEMADLHASGAAMTAENQPERRGARGVSLVALKAERTPRANKSWRDEIIRRNKGKKTFSCPKEGTRPRIRKDIGTAPKGIASKFCQLASGHAWLASFLRDSGGSIRTCVGGIDRAGRPWYTVLKSIWHGRMRSKSFGRMCVKQVL